MSTGDEETKSTDSSTQKESFQGKKAEPAFLLWKDDFILSTQDERFWMKIRGRSRYMTCIFLLRWMES